jgi:hypothetical protein
MGEVILTASHDALLRVSNARFSAMQRLCASKLELDCGSPLRTVYHVVVHGSKPGDAAAPLDELIGTLAAVKGDSQYTPSVQMRGGIDDWKQELSDSAQKLRSPPWWWLLHWMSLTKQGHKDEANNIEAFVHEYIGDLVDSMDKHLNSMEAVLQNLRICHSYARKEPHPYPPKAGGYAPGAPPAPVVGQPEPTQLQARLALATIGTLLPFDVRFDLAE